MLQKYSTWASAQHPMNPNVTMTKLATVVGNEQDHLKKFDRVEAIPHMYINVDAPPPPSAMPTMMKIDSQNVQPTMISRQNSSLFAAPPIISTPINVQTKMWPAEKPSKNISSFENASSTSKRTHKHKHHHHSDKHHHHHHHHQRRHRAKSAESIRNRPKQTLVSSSNMMTANPQYIEQDQQLQQQQQNTQQMVVYREIPNGEGYTVDPNGLATVPYQFQNEGASFDDQQAPMYVYRDGNIQQQAESIVADGIPQQIFYNQDQDGFLQQSDGTVCLAQQQPSQIVYCTEPNQHEYLCTSNNNNNTNIIQQTMPTPQQQFICVDNLPTTIQPTIINQIPVYNGLSTNTVASPSIISLPQSQIQRTASILVQQPKPQPLQIIQQPQPLQLIQQTQPIQMIQQPQQLQVIQTSQAPPTQFVQLAQATPQMVQAQPFLQTIQIPTQTVAGSPQILYQRPYDPIVVPVQNQAMAVVNPNNVALSQPSYAPSRVIPSTQATHSDGANMFRHALIRTVAGRTGLPIPPTTTAGTGSMQLMQPTIAGQAPAMPTSNIVLSGGAQRPGSLPIVPLTPGGLLIPFQLSETSGLRSGPLPRAQGYPSTLQTFADIQEQIEQKRDQLQRSLQQTVLNNQRSAPRALSTVARNQNTPYASGNTFSTGTRPIEALNQSNTTTGFNYSQSSFPGTNTRSNALETSIGPYSSVRR